MLAIALYVYTYVRFRKNVAEFRKQRSLRRMTVVYDADISEV